MLRKSTIVAALAGAALALGLSAPVSAAEGAHALPKLHWTFDGPFGKFDQTQLQRGYKVYNEVCSACHSLNQLAYRNLAADYGPFYDPKYPVPNDNPRAKAVAAAIEVADIDSETGDSITRPATPADKFRKPFPNAEAAAAANNGKAPPDLSVITKARHGGADYVHALLTGYTDAPKDFAVPPGGFYNKYFPGNAIAMAPPLRDDGVTFDDGTKATVNQQATDVAAFLSWASEPKQTERKKMGFAVVIYLLLLSGLLYASYRTIWKNIAH